MKVATGNSFLGCGVISYDGFKFVARGGCKLLEAQISGTESSAAAGLKEPSNSMHDNNPVSSCVRTTLIYICKSVYIYDT